MLQSTPEVYHNHSTFDKCSSGTFSEQETPRVVRKFINPAIYVETPLFNDVMPSFKKSSLHFNCTDDNGAVSARYLKIKRCVCSTDKENCPCHPEFANCKFDQRPGTFSSSSSSSTTGATTIRKVSSSRANMIKASQTSLATSTTIRQIDEEERQKVFNDWLAKKQKEKVRQQRKEEIMKQLQEEERQRQLEIERENFRKWLANKKKEEELQREAKQRELEMELIREAEKERRGMENELHYQLWLKRKEKEYLEKKIEEKTKLMRAAEERQRRLEESARAYEEWLKNSKYKPKPLPLNQGLDSLRASVSVTYVNPTPWVPNVEQRIKPESQ